MSKLMWAEVEIKVEREDQTQLFLSLDLSPNLPESRWVRSRIGRAG